MKKFYLSLLLLCLITLGSCNIIQWLSQGGDDVSIGPSISYGGSNYHGNGASDDSESIGSIALGAYFYWALLQNYPMLSLRSGMMYNQYGSRQEYDGNGMSYSYSMRDRLSYLTVPIMVSYMVLNSVVIEAGPDLSYLLGAKHITKVGGNKTTYNNKDYLNDVMLGFQVGTLYRHPSGIGAFLQYNRSLSSVWPNDYGSKIYNGRISLGLNYNINRNFNKERME
jgi:hypothetical protein